MPRGRLLLIIGIVCSLGKSYQAQDGTACSVPNITRVNFQNSIEVLNGTNRTLSCEIHSDTALKEEPIWRKDDSRLPTGIKYIVESASCSNSTSQTCLVSNLTLINAVRFEYKNPYVGNYSLTAENDCGNSTVYVHVEILIPSTCEDDYNKPPQFKSHPPLVVEAVEGHSVTITAQYEGNKNDRNLGVYWCVYKTQDDYYCYNLTEDDNYNVSIDGCPPDNKNCCYFTVLLKIKSVTRNLTLQSMVVWQQDPKNFIPGNSSLVANVYPALDKRIPNINKCVELTEGQSTEFTCIYNASTNPNVTITTWKFNEELLKHDSSHYTVTTEYGSDPVNVNRVLSRITLSNVKPDNAGTYTCQCAYNPKVIVDDKDVVSEAGSFCLKVIPVPWWLYTSVAVGVIILILVVLLILFCYCKRRKKKKSGQTSEADNENAPLLSQMMNVVDDNHSINNQNGLRERNPSRLRRDVAISTDQADNQEKSTKYNDATAAVTAVGTATATATSATGTATVTITADDNGTITATATAEPEGTCNQLSISRNGHLTTKSSTNSKPLLNRLPPHLIECESDGGKRITANTSDDTSSTDHVENQDMLFSGQDPHPSHQISHHQSGDVVTEDNVHDQLPAHSTSLESFISPSGNGHVDQPVTCSQDVQHGNNKAEKPVILVLPTEEPIECDAEAPRIPHPAAVGPPGSELVLPRPSNQAKNNVPSVDSEVTAEVSTGCHNEILNLIAPEFKHINMVSLLPHLQQHGLVTEDEEHHLSIDRHSSVKKAQLLLKYLKRKGNESLQKFLCCLNLADEHSGHKGIADKLKQMMEAKNIECADFCTEHPK